MNTISDFLALHGGMLLGGSTLLLAIGAGSVALQRSPIHRQRLGELSIVAVLVWLLLACLPLPRILSDQRMLPDHSSRETLIAAGVTDWRPVQAVSHPNLETDGRPTPAMEPYQRDTEVLEQEFTSPTSLAADMAKLSDEPKPIRPPVEQSEPLSIPSVEQPVPSAEATAGVTPWHLDWFMAILPTAFVVGTGACLAWILLGQFLLWRIRRSAMAVEPWLASLFESLPSAQVRRPRLIVSARCDRAMTWGAWRATIALPADMCRPMNAGQLRQVLLHELGHIAQRDARGTLLFNLAFPVLYFHPLYWWLRSRARLAGELIADDWAAGHSTRETYAQELIRLARGGQSSGRSRLCYLGTTGVFQTPSQFYRRMHMLLHRQGPLATSCSRTWRLTHALIACLAVGVASALVGVQPAGAQAPPDDTKLRQLQAERDDLQKQVADLQAKLNDLAAAVKSQCNRSLDANQAAGSGDLGARLQQARIDFKQMRTGNGEIDKQKLIAGLKALAELRGEMKKNGRSADEMLAEVYFHVLQRLPTSDELAAGRERLKQHPDGAFDDLACELLKAGHEEAASPPGSLTLGGAKADPNGKANKGPTPLGDEVSEAPTVTVLDGGRGIQVLADEKSIAAFDSATGKVIWKSALKRPVKPPLKIMVAGDNVTVLDNDARVIVIDQKTGKVIAETKNGGDPFAASKSHKKADPTAAAKANYALTLGSANQAFLDQVKSPYGGQNNRWPGMPTGATGGELDLISLATAYTDAVGNVDIAKVRIEQAERRVRETPAAGNEDVLIGQINLKTADRKVAVLRAIVEEALAAAKRELDNAASPSRQSELTSRAAVLKAILQVDAPPPAR